MKRLSRVNAFACINLGFGPCDAVIKILTAQMILKILKTDKHTRSISILREKDGTLLHIALDVRIFVSQIRHRTYVYCIHHALLECQYYIIYLSCPSRDWIPSGLEKRGCGR